MAKQIKKAFYTPGKVKTIEDLSNTYLNKLNTNSTIFRKDLNRVATHTLSVQNLMDTGSKVLKQMEKFLLAQNKTLDDLFVEGLTSVDRTQQGKLVLDQFDNLKKQAQFAFGSNFFTSRNEEFGHVDIPVVGIRLAALADALQRYEDVLVQVKKGTPRENVQADLREEGVAKPGIGKIGAVFANSAADVRIIKKEIQKMLLGVKVVEGLPLQKELNKKEKYFAVVDGINAIDNKQHELNIFKKKGIDVLKGKVDVRLEIENKSYNQYKAFFQRAFGRNASAIINKGVAEKEFKKLFLDEFDIGNLVGSPGIENKIVKDITEIAKGKKPTGKATAKKVTRRVKKAVPRRTKKVNTKAKGTKNKLAKQAAKTVAVAKAVKRTGGKKSKTSTDALNLAKVQTAINRKLPAEVRRNMGRPALINQTGRFSNSVRLTGLRQAPASIVADYTYQLNPYETFENNGVRKWPAGYNPKPLISKSIRNLAAAFIDQKFTLRRV